VDSPEKNYQKKTPSFKQDCSRLIAENRLDQALEKMQSFTNAHGLTEWHNQVILQAGKWEQYATHIRQGTVDYEDLTRTHANISLALLEIIKSLPSEEQLPTKKKRLSGIREGQLKFQIMWVLLFGKVFFVGYLATLLDTGDIPFKGFLLISGVILPNFASHLSSILQERLSKKYNHDSSKSKRINRGIQWFIYFIVSFYVISLFLILESYMIGTIPRRIIVIENGVEVTTFENLLLLLALIESSLGVYVGSVVHNLFKGKET